MTGSASVSNLPRSHSPTPEAVWHTAFMPCRPIPTSSMLPCFPGSWHRRAVSAAQHRPAGRQHPHAGREFLLGRKVRPLTDTVRAKTPVQVDYTIEANITIYRDQDANSVKDNANSAIQNWVASRTATLGRDVVPSQIISVLSVSGVYQVELVTPALRVVAKTNGQTARRSLLT